MLCIWTISSVGRASASHAEGQRFEPFIVHHSSFKRKKIKLRYFHKSVLQTEAVAGLHVIPSKVYIDATGGGGGHSSLILKQLANSGQLIILDRDPDACEVLLQRFCNNSNVKVVKANFANLIEASFLAFSFAISVISCLSRPINGDKIGISTP